MDAALDDDEAAVGEMPDDLERVLDGRLRVPVALDEEDGDKRFDRRAELVADVRGGPEVLVNRILLRKRMDSSQPGTPGLSRCTISQASLIASTSDSVEATPFPTMS